jgi:hypothetical protein
MIGEQGFVCGTLREVNMKSSSMVEIAFIERSEFLEILKKYDSDFESFCHIKDQIMVYQDTEVLK